MVNSTKPRLTIDYQFNNQQLLQIALTHPSHPEAKREEYQRMEFLGDKIIGAVIASLIYQLFPQKDQGSLSVLFARLTSRSGVAWIARSISLGKMLIMSAGEDQTGGREKEKNLEDGLEALIGAIYLDSSFSAAQMVIEKIWLPYIEIQSEISNHKDPKTKLQERSQALGHGLPIYKLIGNSGSAHLPVFEIEVRLSDSELVSSASAGSKKEAEQLAAGKLLELMQFDTN